MQVFFIEQISLLGLKIVFLVINAIAIQRLIVLPIE
jgi:hypothetical protein